MGENAERYRPLLEAMTKDELNIVAKRLNLRGISRISRDALIVAILQTEATDKLSALLVPSWWGRYHNHVYGVSGIVLTLIALVLGYQWHIESQRASAPPPSQVSQNNASPTGGPGYNSDSEEARIAAQDTSFSPMTREQFVSKRTDPRTTSLQTDQLEKDLLGKTVIWTGRMNSINSAYDGGVEVVISSGTTGSGANAFLHFDSAQRGQFLSLKEGQSIRFTCTVSRFALGDPFLEKCKLLSLVNEVAPTPKNPH